MDEEILHNLNRRLDLALERGRKIVEDEQLEQRIDELKRKTEAAIREHPLRSVAVGLFAGYVIGKLFSSDD